MAERRDAEEPRVRPRPWGTPDPQPALPSPDYGAAIRALQRLAAFVLGPITTPLAQIASGRAADLPPEEVPDVVRLAEIAAGRTPPSPPARSEAIMAGPGRDVARSLMPPALVRKLERIPQEVRYTQTPLAVPRYAAATGTPRQFAADTLSQEPAEALAARGALRDARSGSAPPRELTVLTPRLIYSGPTHEALHTLYRFKTGEPFVPAQHAEAVLAHFLDLRPNLLPISRIDQLADKPQELLLDFLAANALRRQGSALHRLGDPRGPVSPMAHLRPNTLAPIAPVPEFLTPTLRMFQRAAQPR